jgi:hypothetical protein
LKTRKTNPLQKSLKQEIIETDYHFLDSLKGSRSLLVLLIVFLCTGLRAQVIPYSEALVKAAVIQFSINNQDTNGIIIGNGDISA